MESLAGKVVLVTGAAKRIGRGIALRLAREGARVAIHYSRSEKEARQTAEDCGGAELFRANLESVAEIASLFADLEQRMGRLDGLVNNAARFTRFDPLDITEQDWDFIHSDRKAWPRSPACSPTWSSAWGAWMAWSIMPPASPASTRSTLPSRTGTSSIPSTSKPCSSAARTAPASCTRPAADGSSISVRSEESGHGRNMPTT